ncbi:MAG: hypothetical protein JSS86_08035 [Cyanobacteria bacterium SZAS LIN-2]|nr:hypothetical protein [Cyanobacteria bacterium SZAS LIN-2]
MLTDDIPKKITESREYWRSDAMNTIELPPAENLRVQAERLKIGLKEENKKEVQSACTAMLKELSTFYNVDKPAIRILSARPVEISEDWAEELFGDYDPETLKIRLWMRTAVKKKATSYGVLLSTFCHEFFHHLDVVALDLPNTFHTRGFYERVGLLYHHIQDTPVRKIVWHKNKDGTYRVDWARTMTKVPG